ncbi:hypothetical protein BC937DRAFT_94729, partial [Endogone sp. FLAS-F59071]
MSCDLSDPEILNTYNEIIGGQDTDWLLLGYHDTRDVISLYGKGSGGLSELRDNIVEEVLYGLVRLEERYILITYVSEQVSGVRRARALVHGRAVGNLFKANSASITVSNPADLSDASVRARLKISENGSTPASPVSPTSSDRPISPPITPRRTRPSSPPSPDRHTPSLSSISLDAPAPPAPTTPLPSPPSPPIPSTPLTANGKPQLSREDSERKARKEENDRVAREDAERKAREEAERRQKEAAERQRIEQQAVEARAREEAERKAKEDSERSQRETIKKQFVDAERSGQVR